MSLSAFAPENLVSRDLRLNLVLTYGIPPESTTPKGLDTIKSITLRGNTLAPMFCLLDGRR